MKDTIVEAAIRSRTISPIIWAGSIFGGFLVYDYPEQWTQGKNIPELEEMLIDLYENFQEEAKHKKEQVKKTGVLRIPA